MNYDDDYDDYPPISKAPGHSGVGVASFLLAVGSGGGVILLAIAGAVAENEGGDESLEAVMMALGMFSMFTSLLGVGLGIAGCFQHHTKTIFAILGLVFNGMILLGFGMLLIVGLVFAGM